MSENRATWLVSLWLSNDYNIYRHWLKVLGKLRQDENIKDVECALAEELAESAKNHPLSDGASLYCDLLNYALDQVDWYKVAQDFMEE